MMQYNNMILNALSKSWIEVMPKMSKVLRIGQL